MQKILILILVTGLANPSAFGMDNAPKRNNKGLAQGFKIKLSLQVDGVARDLTKSVFVLAPEGMSKGKAETYFRKKEKELFPKVMQCVDACIAQINVAPVVAPGQPSLWEMLLDPKSIFEFKEGSPSIALRRDIGGNPKAWYFTELFKIEVDEQQPDQSSCSALMVGCHHDQQGVHEAVLLTQFEEFYTNHSGVKKADVKELCKGQPEEDYDTLRRVKVVQMATFALLNQAKYQQIFLKRK